MLDPDGSIAQDMPDALQEPWRLCTEGLYDDLDDHIVAMAKKGVDIVGAQDDGTSLFFHQSGIV